MNRFFARLVKTGYGATIAQMPRDLVIMPETWSASDRGGCREASLSATGSAESLAFLCGWLGDRVEIYNTNQDLVWWGVLWDLTVSLGNISVDMSLSNVYNRVAVIYPYTLADGSVESRTTAWAEDSNSVARYGKRELLYGLPASLSMAAEDVRDQLLVRYASPGPVISNQAQDRYEAALTARGVWEKAGSIYFTNLDGLVEHTGESGSIHIGMYIQSSGISFGTETPGGEADEMFISGGSFDPLAADDSFTVSGASQPENNDTFTVAGRDASDQLTGTSAFTEESAGATVKVSWGDGISYDNIAMRFTPATAWIATHIAVKVRQINSPNDSFRIGLYPDSGGAPGAVLAFSAIAGTSLFTELEWTEFQLDTPILLTAGANYWIGIRRTGSTTLSHGYEVAIDENLGYAGGNFIVYNGTAWINRDPDADMPFRVLGEIDTTEQLAKAIDVVDDFRQGLISVDSNVPIRQYSDEDRTALQEIEEMLDAGTSTGERLIAWVSSDSSVVVQIPEASSSENLILGSDGRLRYPNAQKALYPSGQLIYGRYIDIDSLMLLDSVGIRANRGPAIYIQESEYDAATDRITVYSEGAPDPWSALTIRKG